MLSLRHCMPAVSSCGELHSGLPGGTSGKEPACRGPHPAPSRAQRGMAQGYGP